MSQITPSQAQMMAGNSKPVKPLTMSGWVTQKMIEGIDWPKLERVAKVEAERRGKPAYLSTLQQLKSHAKYCGKTGKYKVEMDEVGVRMTRLFPEKAPAAPAAPASEPKAQPKKTGKAAGQKVTKETKGGRQTVKRDLGEVPPGEPDLVTGEAAPEPENVGAAA